MRLLDIFRVSAAALIRFPMRTVMLLIAMAIGVAAVVVLTALGDGARRYVTGEFQSLGTHLVIVIPGRSETTGGAPAILAGETPRDLTIGDAVALSRSRSVENVAPVVVGSAAVSHGAVGREVPILGSTFELLGIRHWQMASGKFLPPGDPERAASVAVIGAKVKTELFGAKPAVGQWVRIGERRFRVIGVLGSEGRAIGLDVQELVIVPVASAQALFNSPSLFRILVQTRSREAMANAQRDIVEIIAARHQGENDVTVITQDAVLATFDRIFQALTMTLAGIAAISLIVAGVLIMNVMMVAVSQRTAEVGLLKALGAPRRNIILLFLSEAVLLSVVGAGVGLIAGKAGTWAIAKAYPAMPAGAPVWAVAASVSVALICGVLFGALPAKRAADLDPVEALARR